MRAVKLLSCATAPSTSLLWRRHLGSKAADDVLIMQRATALTGAVREQFGLSQDHDPQQTAMAFLRAFQPSTQHLRSDTLAALNNLARGLLAPQFARRGDGSLVPVYTLSGRFPGGTFFENPNSDFGLELSLLLLEGERQNLGTKTRTDTLSMPFSDYLLYNFPGLNSGWGEVPDGLAFLDKVSRTPAFGSFNLAVPHAQDDAPGTLRVRVFPGYLPTLRLAAAGRHDPRPLGPSRHLARCAHRRRAQAAIPHGHNF